MYKNTNDVKWLELSADNIQKFEECILKDGMVKFSDGVVCKSSERSSHSLRIVTMFEDMGNIDNQPIIVIDLDGTTTIVSPERLSLFHNDETHEDFHLACGNDKKNIPICEIILKFKQTHRLVFCSGRPEYTREITETWLFENLGLKVSDYLLLLRAVDDKRGDEIIKPELLLTSGINMDDISFVLDDRTRVVKAFREMGLVVLQVAEGDF